MGDLCAGNGDPRVAAPPGKRVARHAAEQPLTAPYVGRRVARATPDVVVEAPRPRVVAEPVGVFAELAPLAPFTSCEPTLPVTATQPAEPLVLVAPEKPTESVLLVEPVVVEPVLVEPVVVEPVVVEPVVVEPVVVEPAPVDLVEPEAPVAVEPRPGGRRVAPRRGIVTRLPGAPLVMGLAILAVSAGGALQAMHPDAAGATDSHRLVAANALSGTSAVGSANLLGGRGAVVSRSSDRTSLQKAADKQAEQRGAALSQFAAQAEKQAAEIRLHQWVLPVTPGAYHLTARFGEYSYLWSNMHTGLDFAAPTGTPIMAVAGGTITDVGYSGAYGNRTVETLPDGTELWYCHQNTFGTSVGATVKPGQVIGYVGSTGNVTGPHLHLEVHPGGGDPVDPYTALLVHGLHP